MVACFVLGTAMPAEGQFVNKWLSAGSYHSWYAEIGGERESGGFVGTQQDGMRWPGIYNFTDMQAAKALWIGALNFTDENGTNFPHRVVHVGPRVNGSGEFFPVRFELVTRFPVPEVSIDGNLSESDAAMVVESVDPTIAADAMIINEVNTLLGVTMERRIMQFSQEFHDNYHIIEYTFTNTGNTDGDADIELPNNTVEGLYLFWQWRLSVAKETRYVIGNGTGWGLNAMLDARGDGIQPDPAGEDFRAQFVWHGKFPPFTQYDNLGGPILPEALPALQVASDDTLGRFGASQFVGIVTLHADASASDDTDDARQPSTTAWLGSDDQYQSNNDAFNPTKMKQEYEIMSAGHPSQRHAYVVEPTGLPGFLRPTGDPSLGTPGGFSNAKGFGPYTLAPGESVRIVMAEAAAGLSREANEALGRAFKASGANADAQLTYVVNGSPVQMTKNEWVFTSRDSLFQTFRRAQANFDSGYNIPKPPDPPSVFEIFSRGDGIQLEWQTDAGASPDGFEIYRASEEVDSTYHLIHVAGPGERSFLDTEPQRGFDQYYYIQAFRDNASDGSVETPAGRLRSSRYFSQAYFSAERKQPAAASLDSVVIVPNPFVITGGQGTVRYPVRDRLSFFKMPATATIKIYTELGELVDTIQHDDGTGTAVWLQDTASRQIVVSGIYIAVITDNETGQRVFKKFIVIR